MRPSLRGPGDGLQEIRVPILPEREARAAALRLRRRTQQEHLFPTLSRPLRKLRRPPRPGVVLDELTPLTADSRGSAPTLIFTTAPRRNSWSIRASPWRTKLRVFGEGGKERLGWVVGFEPTTAGATVRSSTPELHPPYRLIITRGQNRGPSTHGPPPAAVEAGGLPSTSLGRRRARREAIQPGVTRVTDRTLRRLHSVLRENWP